MLSAGCELVVSSLHVLIPRGVVGILAIKATASVKCVCTGRTATGRSEQLAHLNGQQHLCLVH